MLGKFKIMKTVKDRKVGEKENNNKTIIDYEKYRQIIDRRIEDIINILSSKVQVLFYEYVDKITRQKIERKPVALMRNVETVIEFTLEYSKKVVIKKNSTFYIDNVEIKGIEFVVFTGLDNDNIIRLFIPFELLFK